jgi:quercetin dioxygenase-like cupin family protein
MGEPRSPTDTSVKDHEDDCMTGQLRTDDWYHPTPRMLISGQGDVFTLVEEVRNLRLALEPTSGSQAVKTLAKTDGLRVTMVLLEQRATLKPESTSGGASVHVIEGHLQAHVAEDQWDVGPGEMIVLGENLQQPLSAVEPSALLVTIAWPAGADASERDVGTEPQ